MCRSKIGVLTFAKLTIRFCFVLRFCFFGFITPLAQGGGTANECETTRSSQPSQAKFDPNKRAFVVAPICFVCFVICDYLFVLPRDLPDLLPRLTTDGSDSLCRTTRTCRLNLSKHGPQIGSSCFSVDPLSRALPPPSKTAVRRPEGL